MINPFLSFLRQQAGATPDKVAELLGIELHSYQMLEEGIKSPTDAQLKKLSRVFGISLDWLQTAAEYSKRLRYCEQQLKRREWVNKMLVHLIQILRLGKRPSNSN